MNTQPEAVPPKSAVLAGGRFRWPAFLLWMPAAAGLGAVTAWLAVGAQFYFSPLLLFPILVGTGLGAVNVGLMRLAQMGNRPTVILGTLLSAAVAVVGPHYLDYRHALARSQHQMEAAIGKGAPPAVARVLVAPPESFADYLRRQADLGRPLTASWSLFGWKAWLSWAVDGLLVAAAAFAIVIPATRLPYCNSCGTWYRTIRAGRTPQAAAQRLAEVAAATLDAPAKGVRYRLSCCQGGCGPTRLELFWETTDRGDPASLEAWLDVPQRNLATQALDQGSRMKDEG